MLVAACGTAPASTTLGAGATTSAIVLLEDFGRATVSVSGEPWSVAVADTAGLRSQGLMGITDLGDLDGMLFVFDADTDAGFWMKDTLIPLDVAFFDEDGGLVDLLAMEPCRADPCPTYTPSGDYRFALEASQGRLAAIDDLRLDLDGWSMQ